MALVIRADSETAIGTGPSQDPWTLSELLQTTVTYPWEILIGRGVRHAIVCSSPPSRHQLALDGLGRGPPKMRDELVGRCPNACSVPRSGCEIAARLPR